MHMVYDTCQYDTCQIEYLQDEVLFPTTVSPSEFPALFPNWSPISYDYAVAHGFSVSLPGSPDDYWYRIVEKTDSTGLMSYGAIYYQPKADESANWVLGTPNTSFYDVEDVYFLYDTGKQLLESANQVNELLSLKIGAYNLVTMLTTTGFIVFATWIIIKWIVPV